MRSAEVIGIRLLLRMANVPTGERQCVEGKVAHMPGPKLVALLEAPASEREAMFEEFAFAFAFASVCAGR